MVFLIASLMHRLGEKKAILMVHQNTGVLIAGANNVDRKI